MNKITSDLILPTSNASIWDSFMDAHVHRTLVSTGEVTTDRELAERILASQERQSAWNKASASQLAFIVTLRTLQIKRDIARSRGIIAL